MKAKGRGRVIGRKITDTWFNMRSEDKEPSPVRHIFHKEGAEPTMTFHEAEHASADRVYYRSVGSVMFREGRWIAMSGDGKELGEFTNRLAAWQLADRCGTQRVEVDENGVVSSPSHAPAG